MSAPQVIPLQAVGMQSVNVTVGGQQVSLNVYSRGGAIYMDVLASFMYLGGLYGVLCLNGNAIVRDAYWGLIGDFCFWDTQASAVEGFTDPVYTGLGTRYQLCYYA